jgi:hypothetical protein
MAALGYKGDWWMHENPKEFVEQEGLVLDSDLTAPNLTSNGQITARTSVNVAAATPVDSVLLTPGSEKVLTQNGAVDEHKSISELITLSTVAAETDSVADLLPANSIIEAIVARVTEAIAGPTAWSLGDSAQAERFLANTTDKTLGTTKVGLAHRDPTVATADLGPVQSAAAKLRITTTVALPTTGKVRVTVFYRQFVAPTS